jgi:hypothetical protein
VSRLPLCLFLKFILCYRPTEAESSAAQETRGACLLG